MMNGDVKGSGEDLKPTQDAEDSTGNDMDTEMCHTKALSTKHCDNSNSSNGIQVKTESAALPDGIQVKTESAALPDDNLTENTIDSTDQTEINNIASIDESSTHNSKDGKDSNVSDNVNVIMEFKEECSDSELQDLSENDQDPLQKTNNKHLPENDGDPLQQTNDKPLPDSDPLEDSNDKQLPDTEGDPLQETTEKHDPAGGDSIKSEQQNSPDSAGCGDNDSNHESDEGNTKGQENTTENDDENDQADENSKDKKTDVKSKKQEMVGLKCNIPIQNDPYYRVSEEESDYLDSDLDDEEDIEEAVSINSESDIENIDSSSQDSQNKSDIVVVDDNKRNGNSSRNMSSPEIHEINSDMDDDDDCILDEDNTENLDNHKNKTLNNEEQNGDHSDIEEIDVEENPKEKVKVTLTKAVKNANNIEKKSGKNLYEAIAARGTTVTPFSPKATQPKATVQPQPILPSLTDDMFVVEAPSFIVPYVYEKPSNKPFREFVDKLGREIEERQIQEEKERLEKEKEEKERKEKEKQEKREKGEPVSEDEAEVKAEDKAETPKKESPKKGKSRRKNEEDDDVSWDGSATTDSEDEGLSDDNKMEIIKEKDDSIEEIKDVVAGLSSDKIITSVPDNYFDCTLGKFFMDIGINLVQEYVQNDLIKTQTRKLSREKRHGQNTRAVESSINSLMKNLELSKENNAPYTFEYKKCEFCSFRTESKLIMANHLETPHMRNNLHRCNFCPYEVKSPHEIIMHMDKQHNVKGKLERAPASQQCVNCPFEDSGKGKLARHQVACAKRYKPDFNLAPPLDWEPPAKIPKLTKARTSADYTQMARGQAMHIPVRGNINQMLPGANALRNRPRQPVPRALPPLTRAPNILRGNSLMPVNMVGYQGTKVTAGGSKSANPSLSITPLPRTPVPVQINVAPQGKSTFVICEICDGYIKDLDQLRNHMQWIHKVKIHPKMIFNRPPLNCQKCQFRFFTDQGLERHLLGSHGLVTSSMQEAANKGKDAGRCPVCGKVYQWKLLNHVARDHSLTLKPAHLSYKCTVCTATFGMYKLFENHVYSAHRVVAKKAIEKQPAPQKPLKINDEITIIPSNKRK